MTDNQTPDAEPKHVFDYTEWDTGVSKCRHPDHVAGYSATCWRAYANAAGWVGPQAQRAEKAEDAVRYQKSLYLQAEKLQMEAEAEVTRLQQYADDLNDQIADCRVLEYQAKVARVEALAERLEDRGHETVECYDVADLIRDALAEPERDEEK